MLDDARKFLELVLPWPEIIDGQGVGYCNIHWKAKTLNDKGENIWQGRAYTTLADMMKGLYWAVQQPDILDIYTCMSSQSQAEVKTSAKGKTYNKGIRFQNNVVALRSLFMDVDVKPGAYDSHDAAVQAILTYVGKSGMPPPNAAVATGSGGLHVHWAVSEYLSRTEWEELAFALQASATELGLITDTGCTIDSARILRIPNTQNYKHNPPAAVTLLGTKERYPVALLRSALAPYIGRTPLHSRPAAPAPQLPSLPRLTPLEGVSELSAGIEDGYPLVDIHEVAKQCGFVSRALATHGADFNNPLWTLTTSLAVFTEEGRINAHLMGLSHPGYTPDSTNDLYERMERGTVERGIGWPSCAKIEADGAADCAACPLHGKVKSPLNIAAPKTVAFLAPSQATQSPTVGGSSTLNSTGPNADLPAGYSRNNVGEICKLITKDDGTIVPFVVSWYPMDNAWIDRRNGILHFTTRIFYNETTKITVPLQTIYSREGIPKALGLHLMVFQDKVLPALKEFMVAWVNKLMHIKECVIDAEPFGWIYQSGGIPSGFTYAGKTWMANGEDRPGGAADHELTLRYTPAGSLERWKTIADMTISQNRPDLNTIIASGFAGPLVYFTGHRGLCLSCYSSETGIGKTTAMRTAAAVWGHAAKSSQRLSDTANSMLQKLGQVRNLPVFWDELKGSENMIQYGKLAFSITEGLGKARLNADLTQRPVGDWHSMVVSASNDSLVDYVNRASSTSNAGLVRLFEFPVEKTLTGLIDLSVATRMVSELDFNYGQAGLIYAQYIGNHIQEVNDRVEALNKTLNDWLKADQSERLWTATMTAIMVGAQIANELGLTKFDLPGMLQFLVTHVGNMRALVKNNTVDMKNKNSVLDILGQFISDARARHTVITDKINMNAGKPSKTSVLILSDVGPHLDSIQIQYARDDRIMRVVSTYFSQWLDEHNHSRHILMTELKKTIGIKETRGRLCSGTPIPCPLAYLLEFDMASPQLKGFFDD